MFLALAMVLSRLYGPVSLTRCRDRTGKTHRIMLKEQEDVLWKP